MGPVVGEGVHMDGKKKVKKKREKKKLSPPCRVAEFSADQREMMENKS